MLRTGVAMSKALVDGGVRYDAAMRPLIVVTDATPFGDDGVALALLAAAQVDLRLIVGANGNVWAAEAARNAEELLGRLGMPHVEVSAHEPLISDVWRLESTPRSAHSPRYAGALGRKQRATWPAARVMSSKSLSAPTSDADRPDILVLAPATPVATWLRDVGDLDRRVGRIYLMGGVLSGPGNATPDAEFNFWFDAHAAEQLLASSLPITLLPLEVARGIQYPNELVDSLDTKTRQARYVCDYLTERDSYFVCDELLAAVVIDPTLIRRLRSVRLTVDTSPDRYGSVSDVAPATPRRPIQVIEELDLPAMWRLFARLLGRSD